MLEDEIFPPSANQIFFHTEQKSDHMYLVFGHEKSLSPLPLHKF